MSQFEIYLAVYSALIALVFWAAGFICWVINQVSILVNGNQAKTLRQIKMSQAIMYIMLTGMIPALTVMIVVCHHLGK